MFTIFDMGMVVVSSISVLALFLQQTGTTMGSDTALKPPAGFPAVGSIHTAPPPSARFPDDWYTADPGGLILSAEWEPIVGQPYTASKFVVEPVEGAAGQTKENLQEVNSRDSMGRERRALETTITVEDGKQLAATEITVMDPVSHCRFDWTETAAQPSERLAYVQCQPLKVKMEDRQPEYGAWVTQEKTVTRPSPTEIDSSEPLGYRTVEGLPVEGAKFTDKTLNEDATVSQVLVSEEWYSQELKITLIKRTSTHSERFGDSVDSMYVRNIHRDEPDSALFYPPNGYQILNQRPPM